MLMYQMWRKEAGTSNGAQGPAAHPDIARRGSVGSGDGEMDVETTTTSTKPMNGAQAAQDEVIQDRQAHVSHLHTAS